MSAPGAPRRTWLVTGASRGFGRAFVEAALEAGDAVVATARDAASVRDLVSAHPERVLGLPLDVTDHGAAQRVVAEALDAFGRVDVLVNNAGFGVAGAIEEVREEDVRAQFETNVLGALWCVQAVLPAMRGQGSGHIVQVSSIGGVAAFRNTGVYHASKWALEGLSETLAQEVEAFGIRVTIVEPGPFRTDWNGDSLRRSPPLPAYDRVLATRRHELSGVYARTQPGDPAAAARTLVRVVRSADPPRRLLLGAMAADLAPRVYRERLAEWRRWDHVARAADRSGEG